MQESNKRDIFDKLPMYRIGWKANKNTNVEYYRTLIEGRRLLLRAGGRLVLAMHEIFDFYGVVSVNTSELGRHVDVAGSRAKSVPKHKI